MRSKLIIFGVVSLLVLGFGGLIFLQIKLNQKNSIPTPTNQVLGITANPQNYDLGEIAYSGGLVTRDYEITNTSDKTIKLKKITTSCMCTKAKVKIGDKETKLFGMEGMGGINPLLDGFEINPGQKAIVTAIFDPTAHGPQGVGPIDRQVTLTFSDPVGIKQVSFKGIVVFK